MDFFKGSPPILKVIWLLFLLSLLLTSYTFVDGEKIRGFSLFLFGWTDTLMTKDVKEWYCWYANVTFTILAVRYKKKSICNLIFAILTLWLVARTFLITEVWLNEGSPTKILTRNFGYYLWVVALMLISGYTIVKYFLKKMQLLN